ncbi:hypothetical protein C1752_00271 [Acaryochloris thomasi RCC1774]|uniref:DUF6883 domain-containing protein n=1 Tax=Acaryochloris thomasi RCC1774 TaxID=1764569 RepID=A0A2W1K786_9CYAN|nr:DUF6883 domain-containing protein [Acaryochloris thomasi]PZD75461.1 hypothetical protein C1752_00271 [Acaryochloris thomasi RCC1774]
MKLPNGNRAVIPMEKLKGYCLNSEHPSGKHKARVFASVLGITSKNAEDLRELIVRTALEEEVIQQANTDFGQLYKVDWSVPNHHQVILRTLWEISLENPYPRLVSAFIK